MKKIYTALIIIGFVLLCTAAGQSDLDSVSFLSVLWKTFCGISLLAGGVLGSLAQREKIRRRVVRQKQRLAYQHAMARLSAEKAA